jgi:hypothetical protein
MKHKLLGLALAVFMTACSSTTTGKIPDLTKMFPPESEEPPIMNKVLAPEWTVLKSGVYHNASGKAVFHGLGSVSKDENSSNRKILSEDRARDELAKVFTSYMERLVKKLSKAHTNNPLTNVNKDQLNNSMEEGTATILMESEISDHWENPDNGSIFSLATLDLSRLTDKVDGFGAISVEDRSFLKESIVQAHVSMTNVMTGQIALVEKSADVQLKLGRMLSY